MFVSGDNCKSTVLEIGQNSFKQTEWMTSASAAADRIWCNTNNPKVVVRKITVKRKRPIGSRGVQQLRKIAEMITWCLNEGNYMAIHPAHGYMENKFMCLILTAPYNQHSYNDREVEMAVDHIMACLHASCDGEFTALSTHLKYSVDYDLTNEQLRTMAYQWYQLLLNDIEAKINQLEQEAA